MDQQFQSKKEKQQDRLTCFYERLRLCSRKLYDIVCSPTLDATKAMLKSNIMTNCPVTAADVDIAEKNYGPAISILKGKTTRQTDMFL